MKDVAIVSAAEAVKLIESEKTICSQGFESSCVAEELLLELEKRFLSTGMPCNLTWINSAGQGDRESTGMNHLAHEGLLKCSIGGHYGPMPKLQKLIAENKVQAYNLPLGVISHMLRDMAAHRPTITKVGLQTCVDPRREGGRLNQITKDDLVELISLDGEEYLYYKNVKAPDYALLRGSYADTKGNISYEDESCYVETLQVAQAVKNNGGKVFVQVKEVVEHGSLDVHKIRIPGILVDYVIPVSKAEYHPMTTQELYNPAYCGNKRIALSESTAEQKLDARTVIARRAAMELRRDTVINLGVGIAEGVASVAAQEGISDTLTLTVESGPIGGVPLSGSNFGAVANPECIWDQCTQFDFYDGGGLDIAFLGMAQTDRFGNVNVSKFGPKVTGVGGFINITQAAKKTVFCGTLTAGGVRVAAEEGKLHILQEGSVHKLTEKVEQVSFSGELAAQNGKQVLYVTERAVFQLTPDGLELIEIAPGADLKRDILEQMDFRPLISEQLKEMNRRIFCDGKLGLKEMWEI